jgi:hypothetical protein
MIHSTYEGLSKTSQTELLMKCGHAFAIGNCALPSGPILSLCSGPSTSDTAGTDFLKLCVGRSAVPKFRKHPGNNALIAVILFLETRRSRKCPNEAIKEDGDRSHVLSDCIERTVCTSALS